LASFFISSHIVVLLLGPLGCFCFSNSQPADPIIWLSLIHFSFLARYSSNL
jgi:hypothetical protein